MNEHDVVAWLFDGAIYCDGCVDDAHKTPEYYEGWGGPRFADDGDLDACCGTCGHSIGCTVGRREAACYPCDQFPNDDDERREVGALLCMAQDRHLQGTP